VRIIHLYLAAYFLLIAGAVLSLLRAGALTHISGLWLALGLLLAAGLGVLLAITGGRRNFTRN
jgi:hypothetical protein